MHTQRLSNGLKGLARLGKVGAGSLLNGFLNPGCAVCDRPVSANISQSFCLDCHRQIQQQIRQTVYQQATSAADPFSIAAVGAYDGPLKRAILALKYENRPDVAQFLGVALAKSWLATAPHQQAQRTYVLPIPLHQDRWRQRGYNQAALLARAFCQTSGMALLETGLVRSKATVPQHQLGMEARQQNLQGVFEAGPSLRKLQGRLSRQGRPFNVVIVDDIYTTGVTVQSAAKVLTDTGIAVIGVAAVARA